MFDQTSMIRGQEKFSAFLWSVAFDVFFSLIGTNYSLIDDHYRSNDVGLDKVVVD